MKPLVSVLITSYNREKYIGEAIESVLSSGYENIEVLIVDDASTDNTFAIAQSYAAKDKRIKLYVNEKNIGQFANRNKAANLAKGEYIKYVDSDDIVFPGTIDYMVEAMEQNKYCGFGMAFNNTSKISGDKQFPFILSPSQAYLWHFEKGGLLFRGPSHIIFRADAFKKAGNFPLNMGTHGDNGINLAMAAAGGVVICKPGLVKWRQHDKQVAAGQNDNAIEMLKERLAIHRSFLSSPTCPLTLRQTKRILLSIEIMYLRAAFNRHLFQHGFKVFVGLLSKKTVPAYKLPLMLVPLRLIRKYYT